MKKLIILITFFSFATSNIYSQLNNPAISKDTLKTQGRNIIVLQKNIFNQYKKFKSGNKIYKIKELEDFFELSTESYILYQEYINLKKKAKSARFRHSLLTPLLITSISVPALMVLSSDSDGSAQILGGLILIPSILINRNLSKKSTKLEKESIQTLEEAVLSYNVGVDKNYKKPIENDNQTDFYRKLFSLFLCLYNYPFT